MSMFCQRIYDVVLQCFVVIVLFICNARTRSHLAGFCFLYKFTIPEKKRE